MTLISIQMCWRNIGGSGLSSVGLLCQLQLHLLLLYVYLLLLNSGLLELIDKELEFWHEGLREMAVLQEYPISLLERLFNHSFRLDLLPLPKRQHMHMLHVVRLLVLKQLTGGVRPCAQDKDDGGLAVAHSEHILQWEHVRLHVVLSQTQLHVLVDALLEFLLAQGSYQHKLHEITHLIRLTLLIC